MDTKLEHILQKVLLLCAQNAEFASALKEKLGVEPSQPLSPASTAISDERVDKIEQYLGLDYRLDSAESNINYDFVDIPAVKEVLVADNREMMRYRYGTRNHTIDFYEFCHYVQLQAEMLLNYFYDKKFNDLPSIIDFVTTHNPHSKIGSVSSLENISFSNKLWAWRNACDPSLDMSLWENIRKIRNDLSHRCPIQEQKQDLLRFKKQLQDSGLPLKEDGTVNFYALKEDFDRKNTFITKYKNLPEYKNYCFAIWLQKHNFQSVQIELFKLVNGIREYKHYQ